MPATGISPLTPWTYQAGQKCGVGIRHHELLYMPAIGTMLVASVRAEWK
jgi:hypothetical protein